MKLPAEVFADVLQFHQFITNFYSCLELNHNIPTLNMFQQALLSDNKQSKQAVDKILCHMLSFGLKDPGVKSANKVCLFEVIFFFYIVIYLPLWLHCLHLYILRVNW